MKRGQGPERLWGLVPDSKSAGTLMRSIHWLLALAFLCHVQAQEWQAGEVTSLKIGTPADNTRIHVPSDYDAAREWPVILYYHGTNGHPETRTIRSIIGNKHAIVIAMAYHQRGLLVLNGQAHMAEYAKRELAHLNLVLNTVAKHLSIDKKRIYLSGVSKGGWITAMLGNQRPAIFAGMALLMGGKQKFAPPCSDPAAFKGKPIYIGVGETDNNYVFSRLGEAVWSGLGASVSFDTWMGVGHVFPNDLDTFEHWLRREIAPETIREDAERWLGQAIARASEVEPPLERYRALRRILNDPREALGKPADRRHLREKLNRLVSSNVEIKRAATAERTFKSTMVKEMRIKTLAQMKYIRDQYGALKKEPLGPEWLPLVERAHARVSKAYDASAEASRAARAIPTQPQYPPTLRPNAPRNPRGIAPPPIIRR